MRGISKEAPSKGISPTLWLNSEGTADANGAFFSGSGLACCPFDKSLYLRRNEVRNLPAQPHALVLM